MRLVSFTPGRSMQQSRSIAQKALLPSVLALMAMSACIVPAHERAQSTETSAAISSTPSSSTGSIQVVSDSDFVEESTTPEQSSPYISADQWSYDNTDDWGSLGEGCEMATVGRRQSPIDLCDATEAKVGSLKFNYESFPMSMMDTGATIEVVADEGSSISIGGAQSALHGVQFHTPSEHTVDGAGFPMEIQFLHTDENGNMTMVAVFVESGKANPMFYRMMANVPSTIGEAVTRATESVDLNEFLPKSKRAWRYSGSLTAPPCTEGVQWIVLTNPIELSAGQIELFSDHYPMNARPIQDRNERWILTE